MKSSLNSGITIYFFLFSSVTNDRIYDDKIDADYAGPPTAVPVTGIYGLAPEYEIGRTWEERSF